MAIRVLMLDLGETLVHGAQALPHVPEALDAIAGMKTTDGAALESCLVSDFDMPAPPVTPAKIDALFNDYLTRLDGFGLKDYFQPVERRVTLSTQAGYRKPDRRIFEKALARLGVQASLSECLFITEDTVHLQKVAADFGMATLPFGSPAGFTDWAAGPLAIAAKLGGTARVENTVLAVKVWLRAAHGLSTTKVDVAAGGRTVHATVKDLHAVPAEALHGESLHVPILRPAEIGLDPAGHVTGMTLGAPAADSVDEAAHFVRTLQANQQIAASPGDATPGSTHRIVVDGQGRKVLERKRFSAI